MKTLTVNGKNFQIEFRHVRRSKVRGIGGRAQINAITTCVLIGFEATENAAVISSFAPGIAFVAIENAICSHEDNFWRRQGRIEALRKILKYCGAVKNEAQSLWTLYLEIDPAPARPITRDKDGIYYRIEEQLDGNAMIATPPPPPKPRLSDEEIARRAYAGAEKRLARQKARGAS